jgi:putative lipoprotein
MSLVLIVHECQLCSDAVAEKFLTGKITHIGPNRIEKNSKVQVTLQDVSLMDAAAETVSSTTISDASTFPISYKLKYNPANVKPHHTYALSVRINGPDHKLHFINDVHTRANLGEAAPTVDIAVIRGNCSPNFLDAVI